MTQPRQAFNLLDRFFRRRRARALARVVAPGSRVLDVGCGLENWLVRSSSGWSPDSLGIDPDLDDRYLDHRGRRADVEQIGAEESGRFDAVTSLAVIEHLPTHSVGDHLSAIASTMRPGGMLVLTTPTRRARPVLEFLAYRLHVISAHEIRDHQHYYDRTELVELVGAHGFEAVEHSTFQVGLNQRVVARRASPEPRSQIRSRP